MNKIEFKNGSKIITIDSKESIRSNSSKLIYTPCGYEMTLNYNCGECFNKYCEWSRKRC